jgi:lipid II:glycine glycyltransferase (peptidoglycan interpeptide bridge formation enzyme)
MYGASSDQDRQLMPNHLLQWAAIKTARAAGCTRYDMWGAPDQFDESDPMWGVYRFKLGFGSSTRQGLGAYDFPVRPRLYQLYHQLLPRLLALLRSRTQPQSKLSG